MGISERKQRERAQRRKHFVDVAGRLFFAQGYEQTSVEQITSEAEFSKRTIYLYFADKREVFLAVVLRGLEILEARLATTLHETEGSGADRLSALALAYFEFALEHSDYFAAILSFEQQEYRWGRSHEGLHENAAACFEINDLNTVKVHGVVSEGLADGSIRSRLDPAQFTLVVWAQMLGVVQVMAMRRDSLEELYGLAPHGFYDAFVEMMRHGVTGALSEAASESSSPDKTSK